MSNRKNDKIVIQNLKEVIISIPDSVNEKLCKIAETEFVDVKSMIEDYITKRIGSYDEAGIACDDCGKHIKEKEKYYSQESAYCTYEKIGGKPIEDRQEAWANKTLCMSCKFKQDNQNDSKAQTSVRNHTKEIDHKITPDFPIKVEVKEVKK